MLGQKKTVLVIMLGVPVVYPLLISVLYQRRAVVERPALLVDRDNSGLSRKLSLALDATPGIEIRGRLHDLARGQAAIRRGEAELLIYFPADFSARIKHARPARLKLWINSVNMLTYGTAYGAVNAVVSHFNKELGEGFLQRKGVGPDWSARRVMPVVQQTRNLYHPTLTYAGFVVPGVMVIVMQQLVLIALAFSVGLGREQKLLPRSRRWPFTNLEARALAQVAFFFLAAAFIIFVVFPVFDWPVRSPALAFLLLCAFVITLLPPGILIAYGMRDRYAPFQLLMFLSIPFFMLSGFAWPSEQMPAYLRILAALIPATPMEQAFCLVAMKGAGLDALAPYLGWMGALFAGYLVLTVSVIHLTGRRPIRAH